MNYSRHSGFSWLMGVGLATLFCSGSMLTSPSGKTKAELPSDFTTTNSEMAVTESRKTQSSQFPTPLPSRRVNRDKLSDRIPDIVLYTHEGRPIRFYEEYIHDKRVVVNFMYTVCKGICPGMTRNIKKTRELMAAQGRTDYVFVSVSIEPDQDTPDQLRNYMRANGIENSPDLPPWVFVTGHLEDIDSLRYSLGVYEKDPVLDADRTKHGGIITFGNDRSDWWSATSALQPPRLMVEAILRLTGDDARGLPRHRVAQPLP